MFTQAVNILCRGGVVAFPTETYYGLAVDPFNPDAVLKLFNLKGRSIKKPILVLIDRLDQLTILTDTIPNPYLSLIKKHWPGPLTLVFSAKELIDPLITGGTGTVGVRISPHPVTQKLCKEWKKPITATSANLSGMKPAITANEVISYFGDGVDFVIDGGGTPAGLCSTIIGCEGEELRLFRKGQIDFSEING